jgi:tetratricopeptide (TPR) repeat protein
MKSTSELVRDGIELKNAGNKFFTAGDVANALKNYHHSLLHLNGLNVSSVGFLPTSLGGKDKDQPTPEMRQIIAETIAACHSNMAACYLKQSKWKRCVEASTAALKLLDDMASPKEETSTAPPTTIDASISKKPTINSDHPLASKIAKTLFRRASAQFEGGMSLDAAEEDAKRACSLAPKDGEIRRLMQAIQGRQRELSAKADAQFRGFLNK